MPRRLIAVLALTVTVLLGGGGSLYAYDRQIRKKIAEGVSIDGIPVGGMTSAQARAKLESALLDPLSQPVVVRYKGRRFALTPAKARVASTSTARSTARGGLARRQRLHAHLARGPRRRLDAERGRHVDHSEEAVARSSRA